MQVTVVPGVRLEHKVEVSIDAQEVGKKLDAVAHDIARRVQIPGGYRNFQLKVARVRQLYRKDIAAQVASDLIQQTVVDAVKEVGLRTVGTPEVVYMDMPWYGNGFSYSVQVEAHPTFQDLEYKGLSLPVANTEVTTEMVDEEIETVRKQNIERVAFAGERLEEGLEVSLSAVPVLEDEELREKLTRELTLVLGPDGVKPFLLEKLLGSPIGTEIEVESAAGDMPGWTEPSKRALVATWKVAVREPKSLVLPAADDELARKAGNNSLLALRGSLREKLEKKLKDDEKRLQGEAVADQLISRNRMRLPERALSEIFQERMKQKVREMKETYPNVGDDMITKLLEYQANDELFRTILGARLEFVLEDVARREAITVSDEDVDARIRELAVESEMTEEWLRSRIGDEEKESLRHSILRQRAREAVTKYAVRMPAEEYTAHMRRLRTANALQGRVRRTSVLKRARIRRARANG